MRGLRHGQFCPPSGAWVRQGRARTVIFLVALLGLGASTGGCGHPSPKVGQASDRRTRPAEIVATVDLGAAAAPTALARLSDGRLAIGDRLTGRIVAVDVARPEAPVPVATVDVGDHVNGQRGLLGLVAVDGDLYASWTRGSDGRVVVGQVAPGGQRGVWTGPRSADLANGGHLAVDGDRRILIGIGDLMDPKRIDDSDAPNGKILALDPDGRPGQEPTVLSAGWNNPYAFTVLPDGNVWVADNAPGGRAERLGRGDGDSDRRDLPDKRAPSALIALGAHRLGMCGYLDGDLVEVELAPTPTLGDTLAEGTCRTGAVTLGHGLLAVSDGKVVRILRPRR
ncbi:MAG: PQQ-dependent sugar dehydrogenase [Acidimicrobiales bacterium]